MNGRLDTLQAAILLAKLERFDWEVQNRREIGARYTSLLNSALTPHSAVITPVIAEGNTCVYVQYTLRTKNRDTLSAHLEEQGIPSAIYYPKCLHEQPAFAFCGYKRGVFPVAEKASREVISSPLHPDLAEAEQDRTEWLPRSGSSWFDD